MKIMNHKRSHLSTIYQVEAHKTIDYYLFVEKIQEVVTACLDGDKEGYSMVEEDVLNTDKKNIHIAQRMMTLDAKGQPEFKSWDLLATRREATTKIHPWAFTPALMSCGCVWGGACAKACTRNT